MRIPRIYCDNELKVNSCVELKQESFKYLCRVLRFKEKQSIILFNGSGIDYSAIIIKINNNSCILEIFRKEIISNESHLYIHLAQVISRGEKMDLTIQKSVEMGVRSITPLFSERCGVKIDKERFHNKIEHWRKIIISSCEQSKRSILPYLYEPKNLEDWLVIKNNDLKIMLQPNSYQTLSSFNYSPQSIRLLIGSEGGFSDRELLLAKQENFHFMSLGPRVLRTETAGLAAIALLQYQWGDMS